jgi:hypothetical protein
MTRCHSSVFRIGVRCQCAVLFPPIFSRGQTPRAVLFCHAAIFVVRVLSLPPARSGFPLCVLAPPDLRSDSQFCIDPSQLLRSVLLVRQGPTFLPPVSASTPSNLCFRIFFSLLLVVLSPSVGLRFAREQSTRPTFNSRAQVLSFPCVTFLLHLLSSRVPSSFCFRLATGTSGGFHDDFLLMYMKCSMKRA